MKWIGQQIWDLASRFRDDVYFEDLAETTETRGLVVDADGKLSINPISGDEHATHVYESVRNDEGSTIPVGTPVYSKGEVGGSERILVGIAKANDPTKMPAIGITNTELTTTGSTKDGLITLVGVYNTNISGFSGLSVNNIVYVASTGGLTITKPTGVNLIQNVGVILKTNGSIIQGLQVTCVGRTNDVPTPLYIDHANQRLGIGTTSPASKLHVEGAVQIGVNDAGHDFTLHGDTANYNMMWDASSSRLEANDNVKFNFGAGNDLSIFHTGSHSNIEASGTGDLKIKQTRDDGDIIFECDDGSGGTTAYITLDGSAGHTVANKEIQFLDNVVARFGTGNDLAIYHTGTATLFDNNVGNMSFRQYADDGDIIFQSDDGAGGVATYFKLDGSGAAHDGSATTSLTTNWPDNSKITLGTSNDLWVWHNGTNSFTDNYTGDFYIRQRADDKDIIFQSDNGSGGVETYFFLDGSANTSGSPKTIFPDNSHLALGNSGDFFMYHDGTNTILDNLTGNITIQNKSDDKDIIFKSDDGSGGVTAYLTLDGSAGTIEVAKTINSTAPITSASTITADTYFASSDAAVVLAPASAGTCYLRPNGAGSGTGAFSVSAAGKATVSGELEATSLDINGGADISGDISSASWRGDVISTAYTAAKVTSIVAGNNVTVNNSGVGDVTVSALVPNVYDSIIKLLPSDFVTNDDGGVTKFGIGYVDTAGSTYGMKPTNADTELYTFVSIPQGMKATHVDVFDKYNKGVIVYEAQINATTLTSKGTGNCNTQIDITDVNATATNFLAIQVTTTATSDRVFGGQVTIAAI